MQILPVLLCGGTGKRLWPLSRETHPKQFHNLYNDLSLLQNTILFSQEIENALPPLLVTNYHRRFIVAEHVRGIGAQTSDIIYEPMGRNTAGAICLASLQARAHFGEDVVLVVLPIDHIMLDVHMPQFSQAAKIAEQGHIVTFGIEPDYPSTQYGYLHSGQAVGENSYEVEQFYEKPDVKTAKQFLANQAFYWNSGIYIFQCDHILSEYSHLNNKMLQTCQEALAQADVQQQDVLIPAEHYIKVSNTSFDYAIAEHSDSLVMQPFSGTWQDIGTWRSLKEITETDGDGNVTSGEVYPIYSNQCYIRADCKPIVTLGLTKCYVIDTPDALLVSSEESIPYVNEAFDEVAKYNPEITQFMSVVYRPWGKYETILTEEDLRVKRLYVNPGKRLSLQSHEHRTEHWTILQGTATVTKDEAVLTLTHGESVDIPVHCKHRVSNQGESVLIILELQQGDEILETDIIRYEDDYARKPDEF